MKKILVSVLFVAMLVMPAVLADSSGVSNGPSLAQNASSGNDGTDQLTLDEARAIAKEAYIYGYPLVDNYRIQYAYFVDQNSTEYKAPWNVIKNIPRVYTPEDKAVQSPNSDTPYSILGLDLRTEPIVITVPTIEGNRYWSCQLIDAYTFIFGYLGTRATGNDGGSFMIAGPDWEGGTPPGIKNVIRSETKFSSAPFRTQLFDPSDLDNVKNIQADYKIQTLSQFLNTTPPTPAPKVDFIEPLTVVDQQTSLEFFNILNFVLQFCPTHPSEVDHMARFAKLGIGGNQTFDADKLSPELKQAIEVGMADGQNEYADFKRISFDTGKVTSAELAGSREYLKNNYLYRLAAAQIGIYGLSKEEAVYPSYTIDSNGQLLDGSKNNYILRFEPGKFPPANAFWSLTMYELPSSLLYANPLDRYLINSPMLPDLKLDNDGGLTLYIQHKSPGVDEESNWLPSPDGPFWMPLRIYWPKEAALDGSWQQPPLNAMPIQDVAAVIDIQEALDPLPSWNEGSARNAILGFVANVTNETHPNYVEPEGRIATFDNDGTLWCEYPLPQWIFMVDRVLDMGQEHPQWNHTEPYSSILSGERSEIGDFSSEEIIQIYVTTSSNMTPEEYMGLARDWLDRSIHPHLGVPYTECAYKPMLELLSYLRAEGFKIYIVTGGDEDFVRAFSYDVYGIPPEQVIGSAFNLQFIEDNGSTYLMRLPEILVWNDGEEKPKEIQQNVGIRPIFAYGNEDGDIPMLQLATGGDTQGIGLLNHHDDPIREFEYVGSALGGGLYKGLEMAGEWGWHVVSMKNDWRYIF